jgi:hypothetical protein
VLYTRVFIGRFVNIRKTPDARFELATNGLTVTSEPTLYSTPQSITTEGLNV